MQPRHWAWQRQRAQHHYGAVRAYTRRDSDVFELRGPNESPRGPCDLCAADTSLYQSFTSSDDEDDDVDVLTAAEAGRSPSWSHTPVAVRRCLVQGTIHLSLSVSYVYEHRVQKNSSLQVIQLRYDTIGEFNVYSKAEYAALSSTRSQKKRN